MKVKYELDLNKIFDDEVTQDDLVDFLATHDRVIEEVALQIVDGYTSQFSHGATSWSRVTGSHCPLDKARRLIAEKSSDVAKAELEHAAAEVRSYEKRLRESWDENHALKLEISRLKDRLAALVESEGS